MKTKDTKTYTGPITIIRSGLGFFPIAHQGEDILISRDNLGTAFHGDTVAVQLLPHKNGHRAEGIVTRIIERAQHQFVGTLEKNQRTRDKGTEDVWIVKPDNQRVRMPFVLEEPSRTLESGHKVLIEMREWASDAHAPRARLVTVLGPAGDHEVEMKAILLERGFQSGFPAAVEQEAQALLDERAITESDVAAREDFRTAPTFTIDPVDAKDFDDALSVQTLEDGTLQVGVHIADATHYVQPHSELDKEAKKRATSVYLVDRTIPMLPEVLSNDLCSLNPNEEKRAFSVIFTLADDGTVVDYHFAKTLISSDKRFTYRTAQDAIDSGRGDYAHELGALWKLAQTLRAKRFAAGALDFDSEEIQFELDAAGRPIDVYVKERLDTMKLIEEFMLLANRTVAKHLTEHTKGASPRVYRVHDAPDPEKIQTLNVFVKALGYDQLDKDPTRIEARDIAKLLRAIKGSPEEAVIQMATLRTMAKAVYSDKNIGHFSLGFSDYTHFTSPIRRYPDMMVHRLLAAHLNGSSFSPKELALYHDQAIRSSQREVEAVDAERASVKLKQIEYMEGHVGETFTGTITGVGKNGIFVAEEKSRAEGMVRLSDMPNDWYELDEKNYAVVGTKTGKTFRIGDTVRITLTNVDTDARQLDWTIAAS